MSGGNSGDIEVAKAWAGMVLSGVGGEGVGRCGGWCQVAAHVYLG